MPQERQQWVFAPFRLDPGNARLWRDTEAVALPPKVFAVLDHLVRHVGRLVTKEELLDAVWQRRFVSESVLKGCINELRKALGDDPRSPRYIETVARRGYRFIAEVKEVGSSGDGRGGHGAAVAAPEREAHPEAAYWVGREGPLSRLQGILQSALEAQPQLVFIPGEAGIGKTTLVEMFIERLSDRGLDVLWGQCIDQYGAGEAFLPLLQALGKRCRAFGGEAFIAKLRHYAATWLAQMPWTLAGEEREALQREVLGATKERMLRELCEALEALGRETPLLLILEDLHWSDHATLDLIALLARRRERAALVVIGTYRPVEVILRGHPLKAVKQELQMHALCSELALETLAASDVVAYLARRFPAGKIPEVLAPVIYRRTEGHPLFMVNLVEYLIAQGRIAEERGTWVLSPGDAGLDATMPESLRQMIEHQIERLSAEEQRLLGAASAAGVEWSAALLAAALGAEVAAIESSCESLARRSQMLTPGGVEEWPDGTVAGRYAFLHALYVEVLYQRLTPAQRVALHRCFGQRLEFAYAERAGEIASELALHFEEGREAPQAIKSLRLAAEQSAQRFANREALAYLSRALGLVERLSEAEKAPARIDLLHQSGAVRRSVGDMPGAMADLSEMLACARAAGQARGEVMALVDLSRVAGWLDRRRCMEWAAEAVERSRGLPDEVTKALVRGNCASWNIHLRGWREEDAETAQLALEVARETKDPRILNTRLALHTIFECVRSDYRAACAAAEEGVQVAESLGDGYQYMSCKNGRLWALLHLGAWGEVRHGLRESLSTAEKNASRWARTYLSLVNAWLNVEALEFDGAGRCCEHALVLARELRDPFSFFLGQILLARAHLGAGEHTGAAACFTDIARMLEDERVLMDWFLYPQFHQARCEYWLAEGDRDRAREEATHLCEKAALPPERTYLAIGHGLLAEIAIAERRRDEAQSELARALEIVEAAEVPLAAWRVFATAAELHRSQGQTGEAERYRCRGAEVIDALAASLEETDPLRQSLLNHPLLKVGALCYSVATRYMSAGTQV